MYVVIELTLLIALFVCVGYACFVAGRCVKGKSPVERRIERLMERRDDER